MREEGWSNGKGRKGHAQGAAVTKGFYKGLDWFLSSTVRSRCSEAGKKQTQDLQRTHRKLLERVKCCCPLQLLHIYIYIYIHVYTVQVILSASESVSLRALSRPSSFTLEKVRPE